MDEKERFREAISLARKQSEETFFCFFDHDKSIESMISSGKEIFDIYIHSLASPYLKEKKVVLEIGYGGGKLIQEASRHFDKAYGVDIHDEEKTVYEMLEREGISNVLLQKGEGMDIPFESDSVDLVYSFIVFKHLKWSKILESYVSETSRVLKKGGIAVLYFGRIVNENESGVKEGINSLVNYTNLRVTESYAKNMCRDNGLEIIDTSVPDRYNSAVRAKSRQLCVLAIKL